MASPPTSSTGPHRHRCAGADHRCASSCRSEPGYDFAGAWLAELGAVAEVIEDVARRSAVTRSPIPHEIESHYARRHHETIASIRPAGGELRAVACAESVVDHSFTARPPRGTAAGRDQGARRRNRRCGRYGRRYAPMRVSVFSAVAGEGRAVGSGVMGDGTGEDCGTRPGTLACRRGDVETAAASRRRPARLPPSIRSGDRHAFRIARADHVGPSALLRHHHQWARARMKYRSRPGRHRGYGLRARLRVQGLPGADYRVSARAWLFALY